MDATHVIDVEAIKDSDKGSVPVVDLEENQMDEEIILVGEKRKNSDRKNRPNKRRKIGLDDEPSVDPLHLFEQKEKEFQRIRRSFPTTNPLQFLPFEIIEQICHSLSLPDFLHLLCTNKSWSACREMFPWKHLCSQMFDITLMMKLKGTWYERLKFKMALEKNWRDDIKVPAKFNVGYGFRVIHMPSYTIIQTKDLNALNRTTELKLVDGTKLQKLLEVPLKLGMVYQGTPHAYMPPIHVFQTEESKILGSYYSDREWSRISSRIVSRWFIESSEQLPNEVSLEDIFNKKVKALKYQDEDIFGIALDLEADCATSFAPDISSFIVDKITTSEKLLQTEPVSADGIFYHINGDFILYSTPSQQLMILNWKTNEVSSLEITKSSGIPVAVALPKGFFKNNSEYSIYADSQRIALINLNAATIERVYESPPKFKPQFLQLWPGDKSKFFSVGSIMHIWSVERSGIIDSIVVHPVHPLSNNEAYPLRIKFRDNKIFLQYSTVSHILSKTKDGSYELMNSFKDYSCDFDECHLFTEDFTVNDFTPKSTPDENNNNNNQSNVICILE